MNRKPMEPFKYLSLGWGVQSWTIAAMMALDELPRVDYLIHADTTHEREGTYAFARQWTPWLGEHGLTVVTVQGGRVDTVREDWGIGSIMIPVFTLDRKTGGHGQVKRQCTHDWKIMPIRRFVREETKRRNLVRGPGVVESWLGISFDEAAQRVRDSDVSYIINVYPLVDRRITRAGCIEWLQSKGLPVPPKSSCTFCPHRTLESWRQLKREAGPDWQEAIAVDRNIRERREKHLLYVHPYRRPLEQAVMIPEDEGAHQIGMFDAEQPCDSGICWT